MLLGCVCGARVCTSRLHRFRRRGALLPVALLPRRLILIAILGRGRGGFVEPWGRVHRPPHHPLANFLATPLRRLRRRCLPRPPLPAEAAAARWASLAHRAARALAGLPSEATWVMWAWAAISFFNCTGD
jgi:hypothetical protein